jgi:hypothetical protein
LKQSVFFIPIDRHHSELSRLGSRPSSSDQQPSVLYAFFQVHVQHFTGCSTDFRFTLNYGAFPFEVLRPIVFSWIEEWDQPIRFGIVARHVGPLRGIAIRAGETGIVERG